MPATHTQTIAQWQNGNEQWARRRSAEIGIPYEQLWPLTPVRADDQQGEQWERDQVFLLWAEMNVHERRHWSEFYPELHAIPDEMIKAERARLKRMRETELVLRSRGQLEPAVAIAPPALTSERRFVSAGEIADQKKRKRRQAS